MKFAENKYRAEITDAGVIVWNNRTGSNRVFPITAFIYGQGDYDPITDKYPNYLHSEVWEKWERRNACIEKQLTRD